MDVSIIVLTYNQEDTIGRTLDSLLYQITDCSFEIIVGDDCSSDGTYDICLQYKSRYGNEKIKVIDKHENYGVFKNYVSCLNVCTGKYIMGCAGDDWWSNPHKIQVQYDYMENNSTIVLCYSGYTEYYPEMNGESRHFPPSLMNKPHFESLLKSIPICAPTICFRKEIVERTGFNHLIREGFWCEDYPLFLALSLQGDFGVIDEDLVTYTVHGGSLDHYHSFEKKMQQIENDDKIRHFFIQHIEKLEYYQDICNDTYYRSKASACVAYGKRKIAFENLKKIKSKSPKDILKLFICSIPAFFNAYTRRLREKSKIAIMS